MDSRDSLAPPPSLQRQPTHHQRPLPQSMMMPQNSYNTHHHHLPNNSNTAPVNNNSIISSDSLQQWFTLDGPDQYGDGSSPPGWFKAGGFSIESARKKRGLPRKYSPSPDGDIALALAPAPITIGATAVGGGGQLESSNDGGSLGATGTPNTDHSAKKHRGRH